MKKLSVLLSLLVAISCFCFVGCKQNAVVALEIVNTKQVFSYGEDFSVGTNVVVYGKTQDGKKSVLAFKDIEVDSSAFNNKQSGTYKILIKYKKDAKIVLEYDVVVLERVVESLALSTTNTPKTSYFVNEDFDLTKGEIVVTYTDGGTQTLSFANADIGFWGFNSGTENSSQKITVRYKEKSVSYNIEIKKIIPVSCSIKTLPTKIKYALNSTKLDLSGAELEIVFNNGTKQTMLISTNTAGIVVHQPNNLFAEVGTKNIQVDYVNSGVTCSTSFNVVVE